MTVVFFLIFLTERTYIDQYTFLAGQYVFFPVLSLHGYDPHTGLFERVFQQNCAGGCTVSMIIKITFKIFII